MELFITSMVKFVVVCIIIAALDFTYERFKGDRLLLIAAVITFALTEIF